jgi:hypothetical protein
MVFQHKNPVEEEQQQQVVKLYNTDVRAAATGPAAVQPKRK